MINTPQKNMVYEDKELKTFVSQDEDAETETPEEGDQEATPETEASE